MTSNNNGKNSNAEEDGLGKLKIVGFYKRQAWALKMFDKINEHELMDEGENMVLAPSILKSKNGLFFPAFMRINLKKKGEVSGAYLISEDNDSILLIPMEQEMANLEKEQLLPFQYRTISEIPEDHFQKNWPDFS
ncbi:hypothetical protein [Paenisporosarcina sp. NPDC076898]|uniref:hypothetical protein n=1 Tax=unclassified Paenisporosarcina TaxID=2642018 RepID=UPI003D095805